MFDIFTFKTRTFLVDEKDVLNLVDAVNTVTQFNMGVKALGCCQWKYSITTWFVNVYLTDKIYARVLQELVNRGIDLLPETVGYGKEDQA